MGSSDSNCCGARNGKYMIPDDPMDSGTIQRNRRHHSETLIVSKSNHVFEIKGNITVSHINGSHNIMDGDGCITTPKLGITFNLDPRDYGIDNKLIDKYIDNPTNRDIDILNLNLSKTNNDNIQIERQNVDEDTKEQKQQYTHPQIFDNLPRIDNNINVNIKAMDYESNLESGSGSDSDSEDSESDSLSCLSDEDNACDLDNMDALILSDNKPDDSQRRGSNLLNAKEVENWDKEEIDKLEVEMLREIRRLSQISITPINTDKR